MVRRGRKVKEEISEEEKHITSQQGKKVGWKSNVTKVARKGASRTDTRKSGQKRERAKQTKAIDSGSDDETMPEYDSTEENAAKAEKAAFVKTKGSIKPGVPNTPEVVNFDCKICGKEYDQEYSLRGHMRSHKMTYTQYCDVLRQEGKIEEYADEWRRENPDASKAKSELQCQICGELVATERHCRITFVAIRLQWGSTSA